MGIGDIIFDLEKVSAKEKYKEKGVFQLDYLGKSGVWHYLEKQKNYYKW